MANTSLKTTVEWKDINWRKLEKVVFRLQKRIYRASQRGDVRAVRRLQKTLIKSWSAKCLAVRRVTQDNQGKRTAGVDGVSSLTPVQRLKLVESLRLNKKVRPTRRVWIPKPGTEEKRPLGIPTMNDRAQQALVKLALEPEWEARFEPNLYGFRPGRSCHDAVEAIFSFVCWKSKYVLDADIAKCFDRINHKALLDKLDTYPVLRRQVRAWLKAGVMESGQLFPTDKGTPQGGVISPLLANVALHGMEGLIEQHYPVSKAGWVLRSISTYGRLITQPKVVRYADDFVVLHEDLAVVQRCRELISEWLSDMGLELKPSKTRICHTLESHEGQEPGFDFLGFNVRQFEVGRYQSGTAKNGERLGFKTIISPSKEKIKEHYEAMGRIVESHKAASQAALIRRLNPIIRGWANYYSTVVSKVAFSELDHLMFLKLRAWVKRRHPEKAWGDYIKPKYWKRIGGDNWVFATAQDGKEPIKLLRHKATPIVRHTKVKGSSSPFDGNLVYWGRRMREHPELSERVGMLLKKQQGVCTHCRLLFKDGDIWEVDRIIPKELGGRNEYKNLQMLHRHCHDVKSANDVRRIREVKAERERVKAEAQEAARQMRTANLIAKRERLRREREENRLQAEWEKHEVQRQTLDSEEWRIYAEYFGLACPIVGTHEKSQVVEEPDEVKVSRPVLKTSRMGDCLA